MRNAISWTLAAVAVAFAAQPSAASDGRLEINQTSYREGPGATPLLLYDLWNDPMALNLLNEERPDLVEKYTTFLEAQFEAHQSLAQFFTSSSDQVALTPEQLQTLRSLGYIQ